MRNCRVNISNLPSTLTRDEIQNSIFWYDGNASIIDFKKTYTPFMAPAQVSLTWNPKDEKFEKC